MSKIIIILLVIAVVSSIGFFGFKNLKTKDQAVATPVPATKTETKPEVQLSPIFSYLSAWVPDATWDTPQSATEDTPYGELTGMRAEGKITGGKSSIERNFEDTEVMSSLGFAEEDIKFAADGPGSSNWGYSKTENGRPKVVVFSYSTNRLLGPEYEGAPFTNLSVFVSD